MGFSPYTDKKFVSYFLSVLLEYYGHCNQYQHMVSIDDSFWMIPDEKLADI